MVSIMVMCYNKGRSKGRTGMKGGEKEQGDVKKRRKRSTKRGGEVN